MSDSVRPHRRQPTRLSCPWDSPGKSSSVGCHFLLQCVQVKTEKEVTQFCLTLRPYGQQPTSFLCPWDFPGKSIGHYSMLLIFLQYMVELHFFLFSKYVFLLLLFFFFFFLFNIYLGVELPGHMVRLLYSLKDTL